MSNSQTLPPPQGPEYVRCSACSHIEPEHRPDAGPCLVCDCAEYSDVDRAAEPAVSVPPPAPRADDQAAVLRWAAELVAADTAHIRYGSATDYANRHAALLRRAADDAQGPCVAGEQQNETPEAKTPARPECAHCWREIENRGTPNMGGPQHDNWVHVPGGFTVCFPQRGADSPRAEPRAAAGVGQDGAEENA